ncbi:glycoside hydrolase family 3 N-terminal domain-containing protein [Cryptosporangium aurantiacum]|uniref:glycoside hydrolase family 3 N-terminal domain-containing protein n=1 Tax=Cryptosporangium aurantiacum TaxID=134849 RepID=UPI000933FE30
MAIAGVVVLGLVVSGVWVARSGPDPDPERSAAPPSPSPSLAVPSGDPATQARAIAAQLADVDLVGQMLMPFVYGDEVDDVDDATRKANLARTGAATPSEIVRKYRLGGVILVRKAAGDPTAATNPASNVGSPDQVRRFTDGLQKTAATLPAGVPLMVGVDQEHGTVTRIRDGVTRLPTAMAFGAADDPELTEQAAYVSGTELAALGIHVDFAPDADVIGGPGNTVIGSRSYGADPTAVSRHVAASVKGYERAGIATALKHFPGHGHTDVDSHEAIPVLGQDRASLEREDLAPFRAGIDAGSEIVMSGHLDARAIDPGTPASLSHKVLTDVLRGELKFTGMVVTDGLDMKALTDKYSPGEVAVRAVLAGNDLLLLPPNVAAAQQALLTALKSGRLPRERAVEAVTRVLTVKLTSRPAAPALSSLKSPEHQAVVDEAAAKAVTVLRGKCDGALVEGPVTITGGSAEAREALTAALGKQGVRVGGGGDSIHLTGYLDEPADLRPATVTVATDTPYLLASAKSPTLLATYGNVEASMKALAAVLAGKAKAPGRSPVPVSGLPRSAC